MKPDIDKAVSRPLGVAQNLLGKAIDKNKVYAQNVVLTGDKSVLATRNGKWCFLDSLFLLSRVVGSLTILLPTGLDELEMEVRKFCEDAWSRGELLIAFDGIPVSLESSAAILSIGVHSEPSRPWTVINSNGWVARVSSTGESLPEDVGQANPLGALMAASLGVAEVFKRIFNVPEEIAPLMKRTEFSLFEQTSSPAWIGPPLPDEIWLPHTLVNGAGAIGNGLALLLSQLPLRGRLHIVDKQDYADENLGTCVLLRRNGWLLEPKAPRLAAWLKENSLLDVSGERALIGEAISGDIISDLAIDLVLNGFDDVNARRDAQGLWPTTIVDGGINEVGASVIQHRLGRSDLACLKCWFAAKKVDERILQSSLTGLQLESLTEIGRCLTEEDIARASDDKKEWLRECAKAGKTVCSVITEAAAASKLGVELEIGFRPSVPFVATASAAMVVAEAMKAVLYPDEPAYSMNQIANLFIGVESFKAANRAPSPVCQCTVHRNAIEKLRVRRAKA
jgi:hypothetical protein